MTVGAASGCGHAAVAPPADASPPPAAAISAVAAPTREPTAEECAGESAVDVVDHDIALSLEAAPPSIRGRGAIRVRARRATELVVLDAHELRVARVAGALPLGFRSERGRLCARLPAPLARGAEAVLHAEWDVPVNRETPHVEADEMWAGYDAAAWIPTLQDPAQRATLSLRLAVPAEWSATASGRAVGRTVLASGRVEYAFALDRPSPPFLFAFAAGRFDEAELDVDGVKLRALGPAGADLASALTITAPMLRFFRAQIGVPFPGAEYREVFVRGEAAQEAAGFSLLSAESLDDVRKDPTEDWIFSHELAHQWFAWLVPCADFADFWLNEGFATFMVAAAKEQRWGRGAYDRELALWRKRSTKVHVDGRDAPLSLSGPRAGSTGPRPVYRPPAPGAPSRVGPRESELQARGVTYSRGALVLDKLRTELGAAVFWRGIRRYVEERAWKGARSEDLRAALEAVSGRDLRPFFATWVYAPAADL